MIKKFFIIFLTALFVNNSSAGNSQCALAYETSSKYFQEAFHSLQENKKNKIPWEKLMDASLDQINLCSEPEDIQSKAAGFSTAAEAANGLGDNKMALKYSQECIETYRLTSNCYSTTVLALLNLERLVEAKEAAEYGMRVIDIVLKKSNDALYDITKKNSNERLSEMDRDRLKSEFMMINAEILNSETSDKFIKTLLKRINILINRSYNNQSTQK